ncbi:MAG: M48 family metallopeptidase [Bacteroidaceae bacterium]|nr:M48 family metallopeptidase [Bacteroidaceae bacterium]
MLYWIIITIVVAEFIYSVVLSVLNRRASHNPIPNLLEGVYNQEAYKKQQAYSRENARAGLVSSCIDTALLLGLFALGGFCWFDGVARGVSSDAVVMALVYFGMFYLVDWFVGLPFSVYSTFHIEEKYGFNRTTPWLFVTDTLKGMLISILLYALLIGVVVWIYGQIPQYFWLVAWGVLSVIMLVLQFFYSDVIVPLFNKQTPLPAGELRSAIETFAQQVDFKLDNIYVIDGSKRSSKANAYFTGFGAKKRVVLYDTLMEQLTTEEIVAVLAHEIGHYKHRHIVKGIISALVTNLVMFYLFSLVIDSREIAAAAGCSEASFHINMTVFMLLFTPIQVVTSLIGNVVSRRHEWQADEFARVHGMGKALGSALRKMSAKSLSNLTPHPAVVFTQYSHPTLLQRVEHVE